MTLTERLLWLPNACMISLTIWFVLLRHYWPWDWKGKRKRIKLDTRKHRW